MNNMKLTNRHVFKMVRIIKKNRISDFLIDIIKNRGKKDRESVGINVVEVLIEVFSDEESEAMLYDFLADVSKKTVSEISDMPIDETKGLLSSIAENNNLKSFFHSVTAILKKS